MPGVIRVELSGAGSFDGSARTFTSDPDGPYLIKQGGIKYEFWPSGCHNHRGDPIWRQSHKSDKLPPPAKRNPQASE